MRQRKPLMHIAVVNHYAVPPGVGGGTRHADLARQWAAHGHSVTILASSFNHFAPTERLPHQTALARGAHLITRWTPGYSGNGVRRAVDMLWFAGRAATVGHRVVGTASVVVGSSPHPLAAYAGLRLSRRLGVPFVLEVRDLWPQTLVDLGALPADSRATEALYRLESRLVRGATTVVYVPPGANRYLIERGMCPRRAVHIPNATAVEDVEEVPQHPLLDLVAQKRRDRLTIFTYTGALGFANDVATILEAAHLARGDGAFLLVCGDGPERATLAASIQERGITNVHLAGQVPKPVALAVQRASDANVFHLRPAPVFQYGLSPNKLADYLMSGRPLLYAGPDVDSPAARVGTAVTARPSDPTSVADAMRSITSMPLAERMARGSAGRAYAERHHTTERTARDFVDVLQESIDAHRTSVGHTRRP